MKGQTSAGRRVDIKALNAEMTRKGKAFATDKGGGSGRIGTRNKVIHKVDKSLVSP